MGNGPSKAGHPKSRIHAGKHEHAPQYFAETSVINQDYMIHFMIGFTKIAIL